LVIERELQCTPTAQALAQLSGFLGDALAALGYAVARQNTPVEPCSGPLFEGEGVNMGQIKVLRLLAALALCSALVACGDSDADDGATEDAGNPAGGTGGTGGTGGSGGTGGGGGPVECGDTTCPDLSGTSMSGFALEACCSPSMVCSAKMAGGACEDPPEEDPLCGTYDAAGMELPACCMENGKCGINAQQFGFGCIGVSTLSMFGLTLVEKDCADGDGGVESDAGL
jgi:hypothetical protein